MSEQTIEKVVRDGKVAVLVSRDYGEGWYSWSGIEAMLFDPVIVNMVESSNGDATVFQSIAEYAKTKYGGDWYGGVPARLTIEWVPVGAEFRIDEYDGSERLVLESHENWITA
jgi:hypothetical protein